MTYMTCHDAIDSLLSLFPHPPLRPYAPSSPDIFDASPHHVRPQHRVGGAHREGHVVQQHAQQQLGEAQKLAHVWEREEAILAPLFRWLGSKTRSRVSVPGPVIQNQVGCSGSKTASSKAVIVRQATRVSGWKKIKFRQIIRIVSAYLGIGWMKGVGKGRPSQSARTEVNATGLK